MIIADEKLWYYFERYQSIILTHFLTAHEIKEEKHRDGIDDKTSGITLG